MNKISKNIEISRVICALIFALISIFFALSFGSVHLSDPHLILKLRLPRVASAFTAGGLLSLAGALIQLLLQNPLADPYILGISGGSALMTLLLMYFDITGITLISGAWLGSLIAIVFMLIMQRKSAFQTQHLLLSGIALASAFSACISFVLVISPETTLHGMFFWLCGDLNAAQFPTFPFAILLIGCVICMLMTPSLNLLYRNEREARALGVAWQSYRIMIYLLSSLFTAAAVTIAGTIGFVGLIVPHITRKLVGLNHRMLLPMCLLLGGSLVTLADLCARTWFAPQQIPVGIMLAMIGLPLFIRLLQKC